MRWLLLALLALCGFSLASATVAAPPVNARALLEPRPAALLSDYRLFTDVGARTPNAGVTPYALNTALYSDGALKFRYVFLPPGTRARYREEGVFDFPVGTVLVKTFAFASDMRHPTENVRFIETRLLIRLESGWVARPYVWNAAQTEARYAPVTAPIPVSFVDEAGDPSALEWSVPNVNQCRGCHDRDDAFTPIGPRARNLNGDFDYADGAENQLAHWSRAGLLEGAPDPAQAPRAPNAFLETSGALEARARAYLDVNCAHCHNPHGPARTSGLDLHAENSNPFTWGLRKRPVAAGRARAAAPRGGQCAPASSPPRADGVAWPLRPLRGPSRRVRAPAAGVPGLRGR